MTLKQRAVRGWHKLDIMVHQRRLIHEQRKTIDAIRALMDARDQANAAQINRLRLESLREQHGIIAGWLISLERPEVDLRDELADLDARLGLQIAALEEHVIT